MAEKYFNAEEQEAAKSSPYQTKSVSSNSFDINRISGSQTFHKEERLTRTVLINKLFNKGKRLHSNHLTLIYLPTPLETIYPAQILFTVSKRNFKKAVNRNKLKRRMREAYRNQKNELYTRLIEQKQTAALAIVFKSKETADYRIISEQISYLFQKLSAVLKTNG